MGILKKILKRVFRICTFRKGVYTASTRTNRFVKPTLIHEMADIGKYNYFGPGTTVLNAKIGNYCSFAPNVKLGMAEHSIKYITTCNRISEKNINFDLFSKRCVIGNDVWLGTNVVVKQGVKIGNGAIVGANAVVTKDIPEYAIAVGIPAKVIKYRFSDKNIEIIKNSKWWENDIKKATEMVKKVSELVGECITYK